MTIDVRTLVRVIAAFVFALVQPFTLVSCCVFIMSRNSYSGQLCLSCCACNSHAKKYHTDAASDWPSKNNICATHFAQTIHSPDNNWYLTFPSSMSALQLNKQQTRSRDLYLCTEIYVSGLWNKYQFFFILSYKIWWLTRKMSGLPSMKYIGSFYFNWKQNYLVNILQILVFLF